MAWETVDERRAMLDFDLPEADGSFSSVDATMLLELPVGSAAGTGDDAESGIGTVKYWRIWWRPRR